MDNYNIYKDINTRTNGEVYIGVVGPVRTGKSTFIKKFAEMLLLPQMKNSSAKNRATDELPQSAAGRTIMTTEPKFIPERAVELEFDDGIKFKTRLIDCVGYMVNGAMGAQEDMRPRMVKSPWFKEEVPFDVAAETGTQKVIKEHSTVGVVVTTDGTISDIPRSAYEQAEQRVVSELAELGKPFVIVLNCVNPASQNSVMLAKELEEKYLKPVIPVSCVDLTLEDITDILKHALLEFPVREISFCMPKWVNMLEEDHWLQEGIYKSVMDFALQIKHVRDVGKKDNINCEYIENAKITSVDLGTGCVGMSIALKNDIFYTVLGEQAGLEICDEASLMPCVIGLSKMKLEYDKIKGALEQVEATGYGIVMPTIDELHLEEPEIVKQGGRYGVRLKASAPSIHLLKANINTEVSPIVGSERQSEDLVMSLLQDFEQDPIKIWQSNIFGKSLHELVNEGLRGKLLHMPQDARSRLQETLEKVINEGCQGLICIIL